MKGPRLYRLKLKPLSVLGEAALTPGLEGGVLREAGPVGQPHCQRKDKRGCQAGRVRGTLDKMRSDFLPGGRSCVLVVEDDPAIRLMAVDILSDAGFETLEAGDAAQALEAHL